MLKTADFDFDLAPELIAQKPPASRESSRLMVFDRAKATLEDASFADLPRYLRSGDVLVANDSKVIAGRLFGRKRDSGGKVEILLLEEIGGERWRALVGGKRIEPGLIIEIHDRKGRRSDIHATVTTRLEGSQRLIEFSGNVTDRLEELGHTPLPPYIHRPLGDPNRYQTVYAQRPGSAAAPTAGLHFSPDLLLALRSAGVGFVTATLHIGLDTFKPVESDLVSGHSIHSEWASLTPESARRINEARLGGGRIVAVGTTAVRILETAALRSAGIFAGHQQISERDQSGENLESCPWRAVVAFEGRTELYIYPGYRFRVVDALITNFHLPRSSLLMLVSAFAGREQILGSYRIAMERGYRFYSFGDAMFIS